LPSNVSLSFSTWNPPRLGNAYKTPHMHTCAATAKEVGFVVTFQYIRYAALQLFSAHAIV
jgi:hypothetical protein